MRFAFAVLYHILACTRCDWCGERSWPWQTTRAIVEPGGATLFYHLPCVEEKTGEPW